MNPFQTQYPLSPKKFWKKFLPTIIPAIIFSLILGVGGLAVAATMNPNSSLSTLIGAFIIAFVLSLVIILSLYSWYIKSYIRTYFYEGGDSFITIRKNVFTPREIHVQYQKIQDVYVDQDLLDRIMGLYDVHIASATTSSGLEAHIDGVEKEVAEGLKNFFLQKIQSPGAAQPMTGQQMPEVVGGPVVAPVAQFTEEISSKTYPIKSGWMLKSVIGMFFLSLVIGLFAAGYIDLRSSTSSLQLPFLPTFLVVAVLYFMFHFIGLLLWKKNYSFAFLPEYVEFNMGIISLSQTHLPYKSIQDVGISQSILDRMFGLANVKIENAAQVQMGRNGRMANSGITIVGQSQESANKIIEAVKNVILTKNSSQMGL